MPVKLSYLSTIENAGPNTVINKLKHISKTCLRLDIAVAFITTSGLKMLLPLLQRAASNGRVRILTGTYQGFTEPTALKLLLKLKKQTNNKVEVKISTNRKFHYKMYLAASATKKYAIIGSSNLTAEGICDAGEFNVYLESSLGPQFDDIAGVFEKNWKGESGVFDNKFIEKYKAYLAKNANSRRLISIPLKKLLQGVSKSDEPGKYASQKNITVWRDSAYGYVSGKTEALISENTNWDKKRYDWFTTKYIGQKVGDTILYFNCADGWLTAVEVKDMTTQKTLDGKYFIAVKPLTMYRKKRISPALWKLLKLRHLVRNRDSIWSVRKLSAKTWNEYNMLLKNKLK